MSGEEAKLLQQMSIDLAVVNERTCRIDTVLTEEKVVMRIDRLEQRGRNVRARLRRGEFQLAKVDSHEREIAELKKAEKNRQWVMRLIIAAAVTSMVSAGVSMVHFGSRPAEVKHE